TKSRPIDRPTGDVVVAGGVVAAGAGNKVDPMARPRPVTTVTRPNKRAATPPDPRTAKTRIPKIPTTAKRKTGPRRPVAGAAAGAGAASRGPVTTTTTVRHPTTRPTPWCTSGHRARAASPAPPTTTETAQQSARSRASTARLGWRRNGNAVATAVTLDGA